MEIDRETFDRIVRELKGLIWRKPAAVTQEMAEPIRRSPGPCCSVCEQKFLEALDITLANGFVVRCGMTTDKQTTEAVRAAWAVQKDTVDRAAKHRLWTDEYRRITGSELVNIEVIHLQPYPPFCAEPEKIVGFQPALA